MISALATCAYLMLGDSIAVGFAKHVPYACNLAVVGNTPIGTANTLVGDLKAAKGKPVVLSLGSNVLFNNTSTELNRIAEIVRIIQVSGRKVFILPIPAGGKYQDRANNFNAVFRTWEGVTVLKDLPRQKCLTRDKIHVKSVCYRQYWWPELRRGGVNGQ